MRVFVSTCLFVIAYRMVAVGPANEGPTLRIGLIRSFARPMSVTVTVPAGARLTDPLDSSLLDGPAEWKFSIGDHGVTATDMAGNVLISGPALRMVCAADREPIVVSVGRTKRKYHGTMEIRPFSNGGLLLINELPLEKYLQGVIAAEMPPSAPTDALKAQTIAARSYALKNRGRYRTRGYDVSDDTDCQVYLGADAEKTSTDAAVRETAGLVLLKDGSLLLADYYDDCGGVTSPGDREGDYPPSVRDAETPDAADYCARGLYHTWTVKLTPVEIEKALGATDNSKIGRLIDIRVSESDKSGRARTVEIVGDMGIKQLSGSAFRGRIGYAKLKSTLFTIAKGEDGGFTIHGKGYGHGQGLCQMGAMGMASAPYNHNFREILEHYYPGAEIVQFDNQAANPQPGR